MLNEVRPSRTDERAADPREHLRLQMRRHGLSAPDLADDLGVHPQTIYNVTSGARQISSKLAVKLTERFGDPVELWLGELERREPESIAAPVLSRLSLEQPVTKEAEPASAKALSSVLVDRELGELVRRPGSGLGICPFYPDNISPASFDLTIGLIVTRGFSKLGQYDWGLIVKYERDASLVRAEESAEARTLIDEYESDIEYADTYLLGRGQSVGIVLREELRFGPDYLGRLGSLARDAQRGLLIGHGVQIDPGYHGPLLITVFNASPDAIELRCDQKILSLEITRLAKAPEQPYSDGVNSRVARIVERLGVEIAELFDYEPIPNEQRFIVQLRSNEDEFLITDGSISEARSATIARVVEELSQGDSVSPFILPFTRALGQVTIDLEDLMALIRRFPSCSEVAQRSAIAAFNSGRDRKSLKEALKRLELEPGVAIAKLMA